MEIYRRKPRRDTAHREDWAVQDRVKRKDRSKGKASAKKQGEEYGTVGDIGRAKRRDGDENVFARPKGLGENS